MPRSVTTHSVLNAVSSHIAFLDREGRIVYTNKAWNDFGKKNTKGSRRLPDRTGTGTNYLQVLIEATGKDAAEAVPAYQGICKVLSGKLKRFTLEYPCHSPRQKRWFTMTVLPLPEKKGGVVITHHDITTSMLLLEKQKENQLLAEKLKLDIARRKEEGIRKKTERQLMESERKYQVLTENIEVPVASMSGEGIVLIANQRFAQLFGLTPQKIVGRRLTESIGESDANERIDIVKQVLATHQSYTDEKQIDSESGTRWYRRTFRPLTSLDTNESHVLITGVEITAEKKEADRQQKYAMELEQKVEERTAELQYALNKAQELADLKSKFVATTSHEFRTPLSVIALMAGFIRRNCERVDKQIILEKLDRIEKQVHHMSSLLDDILLYGQGESGKFNLNLTRLSLIPFIQGIVQEVQDSRKTHTIHTRFDDGLEWITTDEKLIRNIIINLLNNAIKFSPHQQRVDLSVGRDEHHYTIEVCDFGMGIPEGDRENLFQPFFRGGNANDIQGTGLGLSIVKNAVERLGGTIAFTSQQKKGTTFTVVLPLPSGLHK